MEITPTQVQPLITALISRYLLLLLLLRYPISF